MGELFTINRSVEAPYFNAEERTVGSSTTVARIGNQVYATVPGEGFAEVTEALERIFKASPGIEGEHVIDEGSDTFGYFGDYAAYPAGQMEGDLKTFNIGPNLRDRTRSTPGSEGRRKPRPRSGGRDGDRRSVNPQA